MKAVFCRQSPLYCSSSVCCPYTALVPWAQTVNLILKRPIFGYGPEGLIGRYTDNCRDRPNNEYLQRAAFMGIPGLLLYLAALVDLLSHRIKNRSGLPAFVIISGSACIGYALAAFFGNTMYYTVPFYALLLGMGVYGNVGLGQTTHVVHAYDAGDGTVAERAGDSPGSAPYTGSIPKDAGAVAWDGVQPVFGAPGQWKVYSCRYQEAS